MERDSLRTTAVSQSGEMLGGFASGQSDEQQRKVSADVEIHFANEQRRGAGERIAYGIRLRGSGRLAAVGTRWLALRRHRGAAIAPVGPAPAER